MLIARGDVYYWMNDFDRAEADCIETLELDPSSTAAWNGLGWALYDSDDLEGPLEAFDRSLAINVSVKGLGGKAAMGRRAGRIESDEAREILDAAHPIDPEYTWAGREIGWLLFDTDNYEGAAEQFRLIIEADPDDVYAYYGVGRASPENSDPSTALDAFNVALADQSDHFQGRYYRVLALHRLNRNAQAFRDSDRMIVDFPDPKWGYIQRGKSLMVLERRAEAFENYVAAEETLGPDNAVLYWHADALANDGQFAAALEVIDRALTLDGSGGDDHLLKSYIALEMRDNPLAR